jgi:hypothetical protein
MTNVHGSTKMKNARSKQHNTRIKEIKQKDKKGTCF